ncbi:MAG: hypothetical protein HKN76_08865 [Saprospiraceae bacterium]|nr:hypothetical protein [Saprospiraceae bacterium]
MEILDWFGRFHPAFVHFPIGLLIGAVLFHWISIRRPTWKGSAVVSTLYLFGFVTSGLAAFAGWMLAKEGGYDMETIFRHRWLGILMVLISLALWRMTRLGDLNNRGPKWLSLALVFGLLITGHLGGEMTHGEDYLVESAPEFIKKLASYQEGMKYAVLDDPDSAIVYDDIIKPILQRKCWTCHSNSITKGGLNMEDLDLFLEGGKNGKVIEANAEASELYKRITMDPERRKFMPPKGTALSYQEVALVGWWLDQGAPTDKSVTTVESPPTIQSILMGRHKLDTKPKSHIEKTKVDPVSEDVMQKILAEGFAIKQIAMNTNFVDVKWKDIDTLDVNERIKILSAVADQIAWLDLGSSNLSDAALSTVGGMNNLVRLRIENNPITDNGIKELVNLKHLESLNLYNSKISDLCAPDLSQLRSLKKLFIWQTDFSEEGIAQLKTAVPDVEVIGGYTFNTPQSSD